MLPTTMPGTRTDVPIGDILATILEFHRMQGPYETAADLQTEDHHTTTLAVVGCMFYDLPHTAFLCCLLVADPRGVYHTRYVSSPWHLA